MPCVNNANAFCFAIMDQLNLKDLITVEALSHADRDVILDVIQDDMIDRMAGLQHFGLKAISQAEQVYEDFLSEWALFFSDSKLVWGKPSVDNEGEILINDRHVSREYWVAVPNRILV